MVKRIGEHFEIEDMDANMLGVGGMGTVYLGTDTQTGETVAIKELKSDVLSSNPDILERFEREADALRMLNHPNIVKVLASFADGKHHYIVMEYVSGGSLRDMMDTDAQLPIERVLEVSLDLADALTRAHRLKVIHRDIKPANVLLANDGTPRLTDFGVARIDEKTRMTETGMVVGTLSYLSPEALDGKRPDDRQDIWAFGVMLYEMVAGCRPFDGDTASSVITGILTKDAPDLMELRPDTPLGLKRLIDAMMEKDPDARISSIRRVGTEIENIIRGVDSDEYDIDSGLMQAIKEADKSRFESDSDELTPDPSPMTKQFTSAQPATKYGIPKHTGVTVVQNESGEDMILMPAQVAMKGRKFIVGTFLIMAVLILGFVFAIVDLDNEAEGDDPDAWLEEISAIDDDEYLVLVVPNTEVMANPEQQKIADDVIFDVVETLQLDIPFSNINIHVASIDASTLLEANQYFHQTSADLMVWSELDDGVIEYWIQGGNPNRDEGFFDAETVAELSTVEVILDNDNQSIVPYILGALNIVHTTDGNIFEFMRTFAILEEVDDAPATLESGGSSEHYFNFFNQFLNDTPTAIDSISQAIALDGGNPLWYAMRGTAYMRLNQIDQSTRDAKTAERIGPEGWSIPLIVQATDAEPFGSEIGLLDKALEYQEDWFIYYLRATFYYATNKPDDAWNDVLDSIRLDPQANYPYVAGFLISVRQGRVQDAGDMMSQMIEDEPDPSLGNRIYRATFGENNFDVLMSGKLYEGFGNIVIGQYEPVTAFAPEFSQLIIEHGDLLKMLQSGNVENGTQHYFPGDVMMMMGLSFCALNDYEASFEWLSRGIEIDPTSPLLRFVRTSAATELNMEDVVQEDVTVIRGISDEFDMLLDAGMNQEIQCNDFFDYFVDLSDAG